MKNNKLKSILIIVTSIFIAIQIIHLFGIFTGLESRFYDFTMKAKTSLLPQEPDDIVIIAIDDKSISKSSEPWPWPRTKYATLVNNLKKTNPKVIAFDVLFTNVMEPIGDQAFADAIHNAGNIILASRYIKQSDSLIKKFLPIPLLLKQVAGTGIVDIPPDVDSVIRRTWLANVYANETYFSFSLSILALYSKIPLSTINLLASPDSINLGKYNVPFDDKGNLMVNYVGKSKTFKTYSFSDIINPGYMNKHSSEFEGKIILIGATTMELNDLFTTPTDQHFPGVEIHANIMHSFLTGDFIYEISHIKVTLLLLLLLLLNGWLLFPINPKRGLFITILETIGLILVAQSLLMVRATILPITEMFFGLWVLFLSITITKYLIKEKENNKIKNMFGRYVSSHLLDELLKHQEDLVLGGKLQNATILFSDIKDFTSMSENLSATQTVSMLNRYFTIMIDIVFANNGTLDKYIGDAIMATFGVPVASNTAPFDAVKAAYEMQIELDKLNEEFIAEGLPPINIRIGINTGEVVVGNIVSPKRMEFTVIGDHVNIASRLEGLNKRFDTKIIISESTYTDIKDRIETRYLDEVTVKGKKQAVKVYELLSIKN